MSLKQVKDWGIAAKMIGLFVALFVVIILFVVFYLLPSIEQQLYNEKREKTKDLVDVAVSVIKPFIDKAAGNQITKEEAQRLAIEGVKNLRYQSTNYFWINDLEPRMIMHPLKPQLDGQDLTSNKDPDGKHLFVEMVKVCQKEGAGYVEYIWDKPGEKNPQPKISYVSLIKDWNWIVGSGIYVDDVEAIVSSMNTKVLIALFIVLFSSLVVLNIAVKKMLKPIDILKEAAQKVSIGDIDVKFDATWKNEFGDLQKSFSNMVERIKEQSSIADKLSKGDTDTTINILSENDILSQSLNKLVSIVKNLISDLQSLTESAQNGKLTVRANASKYTGGFGQIIVGMNNTLDAVVAPIEEGAEVLSIMADGDLTIRVESDFKGDFKVIKSAINQLGESLSKVILQVSEAVQATASASSQISSSAEEMAAGAQEQSSQTNEVASAVEEMTKTILETTRNSGSAAQAAKKSGEIAKEGGRVVKQTIEGMNRVADVVHQSSVTVQALGKSSDQIGEIVQVINDIADQTNLLALNAAIEAARAGEQGRGFAVVADEVRKLAERTTKATKEIADMIKKIQHDTEGAVVSIHQGTEEVEKGKLLANKAGESLNEIITGADDVVDMAMQVAAASEEQSAAAEEISKNIEAINHVANESASGVQQIARAAEDLNRLTLNLQELITQFKVTSSERAIIKR